MKTLTTYFFIILIVILTACNGPSPTELVYDNPSISEDLEIEILSPEPDSIVYTTGYDSTGIVQPVAKHLSNIYVSGIKNTTSGQSVYISNYTAMFFNDEDPIEYGHGRKLGYKSRLMGKVYFNNDSAVVRDHIIHIKDHGQIVDLSAGPVYIIQDRGSQNRFPYNSNVHFTLTSMHGRGHNDIEFDIPTPRQLTGEVMQSGSISGGDLKLLLKWDNTDDGNIEIIIGGVQADRKDPFPLLRLRTKDDGELTIPASITKSIRFEDYKEIDFTFIRQKLKNDSSLSRLNDPYVVGQSIHSIKVVIQ